MDHDHRQYYNLDIAVLSETYVNTYVNKKEGDEKL